MKATDCRELNVLKRCSCHCFSSFACALHERFPIKQRDHGGSCTTVQYSSGTNDPEEAAVLATLPAHIVVGARPSVLTQGQATALASMWYRCPQKKQWRSDADDSTMLRCLTGSAMTHIP